MSDLLLINANGVHIPLQDESVHVTISSPPFYGLRRYPVAPIEWPAVSYVPMVGLPPIHMPGCDPDCDHEWGEAISSHLRGKVGARSTLDGGLQAGGEGRLQRATQGQFCERCGGWLGHLGNEPTIEMFVGHLALVFREVRRVLRGDGIFFLNLGDAYSKGGGAQVIQTKRASYGLAGSRGQTPGLPAKQLLGIPWRVALALQGDGWWLRAAPPWGKLNPLPESTKDRPSKGHEYWLMFTKNKRYYYDTEAVKRPYRPETPGRNDRRRRLIERTGLGTLGKRLAALTPDGRDHSDAGLVDGRSGDCQSPTGRQWRTTDFFFDSLDVAIRQYATYLDHLLDIRSGRGMLLDEDGDPLALVFPSKGWKGAHYATFSPQMIRPLIECSTSEYGVCAVCGAPWKRIVRRAGTGPKRGSRKHEQTRMNALAGSAYQEWRDEHPDETTGWRPTCTCFAKPVKGDVPCPKCKGTGWERSLHAGDTASTYGQESTAGRLALLRQAARQSGNEYDADTFQGLETGEPCPKCEGSGVVEGDIWLAADDLEVIGTPTGKRVGVDPSMETGRAGFDRPRGDEEGTRSITRFEQRQYADQLKKSPHRAEMEAEAGSAFAHYVRTDRSGARPVPADLLEAWIERGWLDRVILPAMPLEDIPALPAIVFDPFVGSGSTLVAARALGRRGIGQDLSLEYLRDQARPRLELDALAAWEGAASVEEEAGDWEGLPLFGVLEGVIE